jgi:hypothetical protein
VRKQPQFGPNVRRDVRQLTIVRKFGELELHNNQDCQRDRIGMAK